MILDSRFDAREYAADKGWIVTNEGMEMVAFDRESNTFWHLRKHGGFLFEPYFVWEQERQPRENLSGKSS